MAAAMTTSNGEGCGHVLPGLGIHVNNFLGEDDINPAGFHQLPPGVSMSTMMSPTVVLAGDRACFALGSGGSNRIRSAILQALLNLLAYRRPLDEVVNAARLHVEGRKLWFESPGLAAGVADALHSAWPEATRFDAKSMFFGGVNCVADSDGPIVRRRRPQTWRGGRGRRVGAASTRLFRYKILEGQNQSQHRSLDHNRQSSTYQSKLSVQTNGATSVGCPT
jgi:gamma-glutamyltranspeptidase